MNQDYTLRVAPLARVASQTQPAAGLGYLVRLDGRGRMPQSLAFQRLIRKLLEQNNCLVVIDLSNCEYLDSTWLGCLLGLHQTYSAAEAIAATASDGPRLFLHAPPATRQKLFGPMRLEKVFAFLDDAPHEAAPFLIVPIEAANKRECGSHVLEAHGRLAKHDCPDAGFFERIVEKLQQELKSDDLAN